MADLIGILGEVIGNPVIYLLLTFIYAVLVAIVLPIPIEIAFLEPLYRQDYGLFVLVALTIAIGKTVGAWLIFYLGLRVEGSIRRWSERFSWVAAIVRIMERFVESTSYIGLYVLLSIPLMSDTVPIYLYSLFNPEGKLLERQTFLLCNFLAAMNRGAIIIILAKLGFQMLGM